VGHAVASSTGGTDPASRPFPSVFLRSLAPSCAPSAPFFLEPALESCWVSSAVEAALEAALLVEVDLGAALTLASCASRLCCQMLTEGRGAAFSSLGGDAVFSESSGFSVDFSAAPSAFSVCPSLGACFSVASALPLEVFESSSFDLRDFEPVRTLGLDVRELMAFVLAACLLVTVVNHHPCSPRLPRVFGWAQTRWELVLHSLWSQRRSAPPVWSQASRILMVSWTGSVSRRRPWRLVRTKT
jgi:hypothetical protein